MSYLLNHRGYSKTGGGAAELRPCPSNPTQRIFRAENSHVSTLVVRAPVLCCAGVQREHRKEPSACSAVRDAHSLRENLTSLSKAERALVYAYAYITVTLVSRLRKNTTRFAAGLQYCTQLTTPYQRTSK
jgi:hypothetical protein